ncbi:MAG: DUF539 domain-containing protein [Myxococcota bacterium]|nr:DUF539 domain-containing protein [Myxococcota bacterium]
MPAEILISIVIFGMIIAAMAVGVVLGKSPLKGSCGGKGGPDCVCDEYERLKCEARDRMLARQSS